jgi:hypothetical protein
LHPRAGRNGAFERLRLCGELERKRAEREVGAAHDRLVPTRGDRQRLVVPGRGLATPGEPVAQFHVATGRRPAIGVAQHELQRMLRIGSERRQPERRARCEVQSLLRESRAPFDVAQQIVVASRQRPDAKRRHACFEPFRRQRERATTQNLRVERQLRLGREAFGHRDRALDPAGSQRGGIEAHRELGR